MPFTKNEDQSDLLKRTEILDGEEAPTDDNDSENNQRRKALLKEKEKGLVEGAQEKLLERQMKEEQADDKDQ